MGQRSQSSKLIRFDRFSWQAGLALLTTVSLLFKMSPALAHHAMGGRVPSNLFEGFISGLAHPIIGFDHFAFIVSVGLLAAVNRQGIKIPIAFVLAAMFGAVLHLGQIALPAAEFFISGSVLLFGIFLALKNRPNSWILTGSAAISGLFHGHAYAESIFGAEMSPLIAYLAGFTVIQLIVAVAAFLTGKALLKNNIESTSLSLQFAGFTICGIGVAFLSTLIIETVLPT